MNPLDLVKLTALMFLYSRAEALQALVGENNCGKSNCLRALQCFLTSGAGGMETQDFNDPAEQCVISRPASESIENCISEAWSGTGIHIQVLI